MLRKDAAKRIGVLPNTIDTYVKNGRIRITKIGKANDYNEEDIERVRVELEELRNKPPVPRNYSIEYVEKFKQDWRKMQRSFGYAK